jgi:hypothetical protein
MRASGLQALAAGSISVSSQDGSLVKVTINADLPADSTFGDEFFGNGMVVSFASATCGNDIIGGFVQGDLSDNPTPEPMTMALTGAGLLGLGILRRRRLI